jgi:hypothetical protein
MVGAVTDTPLQRLLDKTWVLIRFWRTGVVALVTAPRGALLTLVQPRRDDQTPRGASMKNRCGGSGAKTPSRVDLSQLLIEDGLC